MLPQMALALRGWFVSQAVVKFFVFLMSFR